MIWQPTPVFLPGKFHGQRSLVSYSPWGHKESNTTERLHSLTHSPPFNFYILFWSFRNSLIMPIFHQGVKKWALISNSFQKKKLFKLIYSAIQQYEFSQSVHSLSRVCLFATQWTAACQGSMSITNSRSLLKLMTVESMMPSNHLIHGRPLLLPSVFPSIRVFSSESVLCIRWPKYCSFSFSISPSNEYSGLISNRMDWLDLLAVQRLARVFSNTTVQKHQFFSAQLSLQANSHIHACLLEKPQL